MSKGLLESAGFLVEVAVLLIGTFTVYGFVQNFWHPQEQIASANAALLQAALNQVCSDGQTKIINFELPQNIAFYTGGGTTALSLLEKASPLSRNVLPRFQIRAMGDPQFLLYFESYNPVYGYLSDYYFDLPKRAFVYIQGDGEIPNAQEYLKNIEASVRSRFGDVAVIFPNLLLGSDTFLGSIGEWKGNSYIFNESLASELEKTSAKYRACGTNELCFKTRRGVFKLPLNCELPVMYDGSEPTIGLEITIDEVVDYGASSPCKQQIQIIKKECDCTTFRYRLWELTNDFRLVPKSDEQKHCLGEEYVDDVLGKGETEKFECIFINRLRYKGWCSGSADVDMFDRQIKEENVVVTRNTKEARDEFGVELVSWPDRPAGIGAKE